MTNWTLPRIKYFLDLVVMKGAHSMSTAVKLSLGTGTAEASVVVLVLPNGFPKDDHLVCQDQVLTLCNGLLVALHGICT